MKLLELDNIKQTVFLCYAIEDIEKEEKLYHDLSKFGPPVWMNRKSILPGEKWKLRVEKASNDSTHFILLFSSKSVEKKTTFINKEISIALDKLDEFNENSNYSNPILVFHGTVFA
jgi:hypothetical protein